jgi:HPt (histidine-containing phosphotransfer) domain-containing protein
MLDRISDNVTGDGFRSRAEEAGSRGYLAAQHGPALAALCADELRERHPRLQTAAAAGDLDTLKSEAHALRGLAANFGLGVLAERLLALEAAARADDREGFTAVLGQLPAEVAQALVALGQEGA